MSGRYCLTGADDARFRASGLDAAHRIKSRVQAAVQEALANDPEVEEVEAKLYLRVTTPACTSDAHCLANLHDRECPRRTA